jgi:putative ABC transport system permease protein
VFEKRYKSIAMSSILQDLRFAARRLLRDRRFTLAAVAALALGIGATSAVFTLVNAVLLRGLPFAEPDRIMWLGTRDAKGGEFGVSQPDFEDWRRATRTFSGIALMQMGPINFSADDRAPDQYDAVYISWNGFSLIGTQPVIGRGFSEEDDRPGAPVVALLSYTVWQSRYGGDRSVVGRAIRANAEPATIIGVMPPGMQFPFTTEVWLPASQRPTAQTRAGREGRLLMAYGRLADGMTIEQARTEMTGIAGQLAMQFPDTNKDIAAVVTPFAEQVIGSQIRVLFWSLMGAVAFVLLIACANVANLLLARASGRSREMAVRISIGATRWRLIRQLLVESVLLAFVSGVAGLGLAYAGIRWFDANLQDVGRPYWMVFTMDATVVGFFAAVCLATGIVFGLAPALYISRTSVSEVLKDGGRSGSSGMRAGRWTSGLIVAELTLTLVLLSGAGLMMRSFLNLYRMDIGIDTSPLVTMQLIFPATYASLESRALFLQRLDDRLNGINTIAGASSTNTLPFSGASLRRLEIDGRSDMTGQQRPLVSMVAVGSKYFDALGVHLLRGRAFTATDGEPGREAMIINQRLADMHFRGEDPVGKRIRLINDGNIPGAPKFYAATIVGVSPTIRQRGFERDPDPVVYITHGQNALMAMGVNLIVRARDNPVAVTSLLRQEVAAMDPDVPVTNIRTMDEVLARNRWPQRVFGTMFLVFAIIAIVLAAVGLYSVTAYSVAQRTQEIGIRMALGAEGSQVRWLILRRGMIQVAVGLTLGLAAALGTGRLLQGMLVGTGPADVVTLASISFVLVSVAVMACFWPARRATRLDPVKALRYQ